MEGKKWPHPIQCVIFDNDGTLMDTEWAYSWAHKQLTGYDLDWTLKARLMGKQSIESWKITCEYYGLKESPEVLSEKRTKLLEDCWKDIKLMPGAADLVKKLKDLGIRVCIATSSRRQVFLQKASKSMDLVKQMDHVICGDDVLHGKPEPDIFLAALNKYDGIPPEAALVFEDSPLGIKAANNAGMASVFVPDPHLNIEESLGEQDAHPEVIISSLETFNFDDFIWKH